MLVRLKSKSRNSLNLETGRPDFRGAETGYTYNCAARNGARREVPLCGGARGARGAGGGGTGAGARARTCAGARTWASEAEEDRAERRPLLHGYEGTAAWLEPTQILTRI